MFLGAEPPDTKGTSGGSDQEAFHKNNELVLVPCCDRKCAPTAISGGVDIPEVFGCHLLPKICVQ